MHSVRMILDMLFGYKFLTRLSRPIDFFLLFTSFKFPYFICNKNSAIVRVWYRNIVLLKLKSCHLLYDGVVGATVPHLYIVKFNFFYQTLTPFFTEKSRGLSSITCHHNFQFAFINPLFLTYPFWVFIPPFLTRKRVTISRYGFLCNDRHSSLRPTNQGVLHSIIFIEIS